MKIRKTKAQKGFEGMRLGDSIQFMYGYLRSVLGNIFTNFFLRDSFMTSDFHNPTYISIKTVS